MKPNPDALKDILAKIGAEPAGCVYVGDNLAKDVVMAQKVGVADVHFKCGVVHQNAEYDLLRAVTHWTAAQVEAERHSAANVTAAHVIEGGYSELLTLFHVTRHTGELAPPPPENRIPQLIDVWKKIVDVQQHFNDMEMRIRNYAITVLGAILGGVVLVMKESIFVPIFGYQITAAAPLVILGVVVGVAFWFMDRHWYHRLLVGSVKQGAVIENRLAEVLPEASLGKAISKASPFTFWGYKFHSTEKTTCSTGCGASGSRSCWSSFCSSSARRRRPPPSRAGVRPPKQNSKFRCR